MCDKKINDLVGENYLYASVLYYFGIQFYNYSEQTLDQACKARGLNTRSVIRSLESANRAANPSLSLASLPVDLVIAYLKHTHFTFVKQQLPYLVNLINHLNAPQVPIAKDLQLLFPLFVEDFIHHIYQEEDTLFNYITLLHQATAREYNQGQLYFEMEKHSIRKYAVEHETHDDEMIGIREITDHYAVGPHTSLHLRVLYSELENFERELRTHANVENDILFPKSILLEKTVNEMLRQKIKLN
ncbi:MAG: iron-sulfur cluster repair di-iron protein [Ferruginibacter sp.]|nr:iron-sulfur cluster repair di-iron protein [Cytophagales bacterium]